MQGGENMKPESISEKMMFNTVRLETESGMGTGFFYNFQVGDATYPTIITNKHVVNDRQDEKVKDDNRVIETHDGKEKDMIAIRLSDVEYAEIFN